MRRFAFSAIALLLVSAPLLADPIPARALAMIDAANSQLKAGGSTLQIVAADFFTSGRGIDSYRRLRTGSRWTHNPAYIIDLSDVGTDLPSGDYVTAIENGYNSWTRVSGGAIAPFRVSDNGSNFDVLDGTFSKKGQCTSLFDLKSPNLDLAHGEINPAADIVVGGWVREEYFSSCLGSKDIIGVTWTFADGDANSDNYVDTLYVEQFYNEGFDWISSGAQYLDFDHMDVESIVVHENGHALGLDHFGGPNLNEPFKLQPNGKVFDPEAVMNPFYIGGEKRTPFPTDVAGITTLY